MKKFLIRHLGNMGDMVFLVPPAIAVLKKRYPDCHITLVTAWGFKDRRGRWGQRNQGGFALHLLMTNPNIDALIHWHDTKLSLNGDICQEDGKYFPTWSKAHYEQQKNSGTYDGVYELDFGLAHDDNPITRTYETMGWPSESYSDYTLYLTEADKTVAHEVMRDIPHPRIVLLEGIEGGSTRGWDTGKIPALIAAIRQRYGVAPLWFGAKYNREFEGRPLTLRENIATLTFCDVGIGVMSGPTHFAVAVGLPTLTLFCDQPLRRAAPGYFLNNYIDNPQKRHHTLLGPTGASFNFLKNDNSPSALTPAESARQGAHSWQHPGKQSTKSCLAVITVDEILTALLDMLPARPSRRDA